MTDRRTLIPAALVLTLPGLAASLRLFPVGPATLMLVSALTIIAAGILMLRVAETTQGTPRKLALVAVAVAVLLPEYSVDAHFAWVSAYPDSLGQTSLMLAATTGSNRLLMGFGLPVIILLFLFKNRKNRSYPNPEQGFGVQIVLLFMATLYAFVIYIKGAITVLDTFALFALFGVFVWKGSWQGRADSHRATKPTPAAIETPPSGAKRIVGAFLVIYAALSIYLVAGAFASSFLVSGQRMGIEPTVMVQWLLPVASKAPWLILAAMLVLRANATLAITSLLTSQMGLWTLLLGALPIVTLISGLTLGNAEALTLDDHQRMEILLTATQSLFVVAVLSGLKVSWRSALGMLALFLMQSLLSAFQADKDATLVQGLFSMIYLSAAIAIIIGDRARLRVLTGVIPINMGGLRSRPNARVDRAEL
ncbi:MAG: hypothetical protein IIB15_01925 [Chloroflexi bacterium]|nr:hypothetical protein [Chloroflexota bacterium]